MNTKYYVYNQEHHQCMVAEGGATMKITKKKPLRPRGRSDEKRQSTKDAIRSAYTDGPTREIQIIPAKKDLETPDAKKKLRVCVYCRVSTEEDNQAISYTSIKISYTH